MHGGRSPFLLLPAWATLNGVEEHSGINPALVLFLAVFVVAAGMALFLRFSDKNKKQ
jgi:hypothetical protein